MIPHAPTKASCQGCLHEMLYQQAFCNGSPFKMHLSCTSKSLHCTLQLLVHCVGPQIVDDPHGQPPRVRRALRGHGGQQERVVHQVERGQQGRVVEPRRPRGNREVSSPEVLVMPTGGSGTKECLAVCFSTRYKGRRTDRPKPMIEPLCRRLYKKLDCTEMCIQCVHIVRLCSLE